ncbi:hypothetical protein [Mycolicibacterium aichiense]|uniref:Uncharacterized protein n=1 Tax=Mycolicibacterium aichiense TaxID=1799 RepID=A0AAD1HLH1_9MYCO|nr:hypothetical protein [Mycolicibacterium aichiense]MCV7019752.1 hypothetical protein [Mycolicibacterium aichiense]BBX06875.1 hypothetical protein MAIC_16780 [Mycolicibacterium aichiense]STZ80692.1 Uncharacterised protein [Mycolicibacterium aichiense]
MTSPLRWVRRSPIAAATVAYVGYSLAMLRLDRQMQATGGPGIIPFELAGTATKAEAIMAQWGEDGQRAARRSMWLDFGYMTSYGILLGLLVDRRRRRRGHPGWLPALAAGAVAGDAVEGVALLRVLDRRDVAVNARLAKIAASVKFAILAIALGYSFYPGELSSIQKICQEWPSRSL